METQELDLHYDWDLSHVLQGGELWPTECFESIKFGAAAVFQTPELSYFTTCLSGDPEKARQLPVSYLVALYAEDSGTGVRFALRFATCHERTDKPKADILRVINTTKASAMIKPGGQLHNEQVVGWQNYAELSYEAGLPLAFVMIGYFQEEAEGCPRRHVRLFHPRSPHETHHGFVLEQFKFLITHQLERPS